MIFSDLEIELGFELIEVIGMFDPYDDNPHYFAAKVLGDSDVIVRIGTINDPTYQHQRFGTFANTKFTEPMWHPVSNLFSGHANDARQVLSDAEFGADEFQNQTIVLPVKAEINRRKN
jgi:hypothetical protein